MVDPTFDVSGSRVSNSATLCLKLSGDITQSFDLNQYVSCSAPFIYSMKYILGVGDLSGSVLTASPNTTINIDLISTPTTTYNSSTLNLTVSTTYTPTYPLFTTAAVRSPISVGGIPRGSAILNNSVWITDSSASKVMIYDTSSNILQEAISLATNAVPTQIAFTTDKSLAWILNQNGTVTIINVATKQIVTSLTIPTNAGSIALSSTFAFITTASTNQLTIIHIANQVTQDNIYFQSPRRVIVGSNNTSVYVLCPNFLHILTVSPSQRGGLVTTRVVNINEIITGGLAISADNSLVFLSTTSNKVWIINTTTGVILNKITVGSDPRNIVVTPNNAAAYISNYLGGTISVIDISSKTVVQTLTAGSNPQEMAVDLSNANVWVSNSGGVVSRITLPAPVFDVSGVSVVNKGSASLTISLLPTDVLLTGKSYNLNQIVSVKGNGAVTYAIQSGSCKLSGSTLTVYDTATIVVSVTSAPTGLCYSGSITLTINVSIPPYSIITTPVGRRPVSIAIGADNSRIWTANQTDGSLTLLDASSNTVLNTVNVDGAPSSITLTSDSHYVWFTDSSNGVVKKLDTSSNQVVSTISTSFTSGLKTFSFNGTTGNFSLSADVGTSPFSITISPNNAYLWALLNVTSGTNRMYIIDASTNQIAYFQQVDNCIAVAVNSTYLFQAFSDNMLIRTLISSININGPSTSISRTITAGVTNIALSPNGSYLWATNSSAGKLTRMDIATLNTQNSISLGVNPSSIVVSNDSTIVWAGDLSNRTVYQINASSLSIMNTYTAGKTLSSAVVNSNQPFVYFTNQSDNTISQINYPTVTYSSPVFTIPEPVNYPNPTVIVYQYPPTNGGSSVINLNNYISVSNNSHLSYAFQRSYSGSTIVNGILTTKEYGIFFMSVAD